RDPREVADARPAAGAPVDQRLGAIREASVGEGLERDADGLRRAVVHRVAEAAPVVRGAELALLVEDRVPGLGHELLHPVEVAIAAEALAALALLREDPVENELGGD